MFDVIQIAATYGVSSPSIPMLTTYRRKAQAPLLRFVLDLLYNKLYNISTTNQNDGVCALRQCTATKYILARASDVDINRLKLNAIKTEFIWLATRQQLSKINESPRPIQPQGRAITLHVVRLSP